MTDVPYASLGLVALALVLIGYLGYRLIEVRANLKFERWKADHSKAISREAIRALCPRYSEDHRMEIRSAHNRDDSDALSAVKNSSRAIA